MVLMIDNYDSFTYNLVQYLQVLGEEVRVVRNDQMSVQEALATEPEAVLISPGPCTPAEAGISVPLIQEGSGRVPIFGICLGHQSLGAAFGGRIIRAKRIMHGKVSQVQHNGAGIFAGIKSPLSAVRYHSLAIDPTSVPDCLEVTATAEDGEIMAVRHRQHLTVGVQFHPESILTPSGKRILANFMALVRTGRTPA
jgi:anthranilate synthase/aminodeoxychorismate synthase-like glutamine amidotransferase